MWSSKMKSINVCYRHNKAEILKANWIVGEGHDVTDIFINVMFVPKPCPDCADDPEPPNKVVELKTEFHARYCQFHSKIHGPTGRWYHVDGNLTAGQVRDRIQAGCRQLVVVHPANCYVCLGGIDKQKRDRDFEDGKSH